MFHKCRDWHHWPFPSELHPILDTPYAKVLSSIKGDGRVLLTACTGEQTMYLCLSQCIKCKNFHRKMEVSNRKQYDCYQFTFWLPIQIQYIIQQFFLASIFKFILSICSSWNLFSVKCQAKLNEFSGLPWWHSG